MPWWGWTVLILLACWAALTVWSRRGRPQHPDWLAGLQRRTADPVDEACADWRAALAPDGSHDQYPQMTEECRQIYIDCCTSMWHSEEGSVTWKVF